MTRSDLRETLITELVRRHGGARGHWRRILGEVRLYARETHPHCNWEMFPSGGVDEVQAATRAIDGLRARHPLISG
ncbi:hypothetical protein [Sphingomonas morindae]|uniref:Uncharacterized protein n=1 Tax=Sphingomonas morindae TaxID=1541170 RepID=A0ABY4X985_9SPHN|nr:hypothetical protein [Sphingomonas morindae]USI73235.1 hypothetical protein LHA26_01785 [Sphingomonas morindae]